MKSFKEMCLIALLVLIPANVANPVGPNATRGNDILHIDKSLPKYSFESTHLPDSGNAFKSLGQDTAHRYVKIDI